MKVKLTDNDPRLTAYALGELPRDEAEELSRVLDENLNLPLKREVEDIDALGAMLTQTLNEEHLKLSPSQRDAIFRSAKAPTADDVESTHQSAWLRPMLVTLGAAALVTFSFIVMDNIVSDDSGRGAAAELTFTGISDDKLQAPIQPSDAEWGGEFSDVSSQGGGIANYDLGSSGVAIQEDSNNLIKLVENSWVSRADEAVARMPMACGRASWNWVKHSIAVDGVLPDKNAVRVEEIINAFDYNEPTDLELTHASAGVELVQCPWDPENMIAVILVRNTHTENIQVETGVTFSESVEKYRLVGYAKAEDAEDNIISPAKITMGVGGAHLVMYEVETSSEIENADDVLSLDIRISSMQENEWVDEGKTLNVQFSDRGWKKAEQDVQFALILASWSQLMADGELATEMSKVGVAEMISDFENDNTLTDQEKEVIPLLKKGMTLASGKE